MLVLFFVGNSCKVALDTSDQSAIGTVFIIYKAGFPTPAVGGAMVYSGVD